MKNREKNKAYKCPSCNHIDQYPRPRMCTRCRKGRTIPKNRKINKTRKKFRESLGWF